ncbi:MAG: FAD binding domain-containing protein [Eubacteriales bacterium]
MFTMREYARPASLEEAYALLKKSRNNVVLGGCMWLRLGRKKIGVGVDLTGLGLDTIERQGMWIAIGGTATLRQVEKDPLLQEVYGNLFASCVGPIVGTQFKNTATMGGSVYARFGFSDIVTLLLGLGARVVLYGRGEVSMEEFCTMPYEKDIVVKILVPAQMGKCSYQSFRLSATDLPVLNCAVCRDEQGQCRIAVGARPGRALLCPDAAQCSDPAEAGKIAAEELTFGSNMRGSGEYRKELCKVLVEDGLREVLA